MESDASAKRARVLLPGKKFMILFPILIVTGVRCLFSSYHDGSSSFLAQGGIILMGCFLHGHV